LAFAAQSRKNCGLQSFCRATPSLYYPACKNLLCPAHLTGQQFFLLFPEAYLLTGRKKMFF
jgi:hypothetical protein